MDKEDYGHEIDHLISLIDKHFSNIYDILEQQDQNENTYFMFSNLKKSLYEDIKKANQNASSRHFLSD